MFQVTYLLHILCIFYDNPDYFARLAKLDGTLKHTSSSLFSYSLSLSFGV